MLEECYNKFSQLAGNDFRNICFVSGRLKIYSMECWTCSSGTSRLIQCAGLKSNLGGKCAKSFIYVQSSSYLLVGKYKGANLHDLYATADLGTARAL